MNISFLPELQKFRPSDFKVVWRVLVINSYQQMKVKNIPKILRVFILNGKRRPQSELSAVRWSTSIQGAKIRLATVRV